jgi:hypothetical protein
MILHKLIKGIKMEINHKKRIKTINLYKIIKIVLIINKIRKRLNNKFNLFVKIKEKTLMTIKG